MTVTPSVHPDLARHQNSMTPKVYTLNGHVHCAFGFTIVNCTLIEGDDACILVDTMTNLKSAEQMMGLSVILRNSAKSPTSPSRRSSIPTSTPTM